MELKNALAVCVISLFSATLVMLIARVLDSQAAARLEPQLTRIVEELEALRQQGGIVSAGTARQADWAVSDGLMVYYLHSSTRCPTCEAIESQSEAVVQSDFASALASGEMQWKVLNYEEPATAELAKKFEIQMPVVVVARLQDGEIADWKRLDRVWALVGDKPAFANFLREEIRQMMEDSERPPMPTGPAGDPSDPNAGPSPTEFPVPAADDIPIPD
jgi:hypothetical protein